MLTIPCNRLPGAPLDRHAMLRDYFCDKDAIADTTANGWNLELHWPDGIDRHIDPHLDEGLAWWGDGVRRNSMVFGCKTSGRVTTCLYDTLTLLAWSQWIASRLNATMEELTILHIDDHRDLGSPRLFKSDVGWIDAITGRPVDLGSPGQVRDAIDSGALGMGSFLTPFLHRFPKAEVRHLCQPPKVTDTIDHVVALTFENDTLIDPARERPSITLTPQRGAIGPGTYRITPDVADWLAGIGDGPCLLHIDMDYFNNRYDGDSDWRERKNVLDSSLSTVLSKIDDVASALMKSGAQSRIESAVVAYSPGFFPAELWSGADARLHEKLGSLYAK